MKDSTGGDVLWCKCCRRNKPQSEFLWGGKRGRIRIRFCNACASANMKAWGRTQSVGMKPEDIRPIDD